MKLIAINKAAAAANSRSREGAWIEIAEWMSWRPWDWVAPARERGLKFFSLKILFQEGVAPARERGLKSVQRSTVSDRIRRSREGAWIEI